MVAFLYTIARRRVVDLARRQSREQLAAEIEPAGQGDPPPLAGALRSALAGLEERERTAVVLRVVNGCSFAEVAAVIGSSEKAAKSLVYRGLDRLAEALAAAGVGE